ncbi:MAG: hypothetical protein ACSLE2_15065 [Lysobacterales bacterium]
MLAVTAMLRLSQNAVNISTAGHGSAQALQVAARADRHAGKARDSDMDLAEIGEQLATRKAQLGAQPDLLKTAKKLKDAGKGLVTRVLNEV